MMYFVEKKPYAHGAHEVHEVNCSYNKEYLGDFSNCHDAMEEARKRHPEWKIHGCYHCSNECHPYGLKNFEV